MARMMLPLIFVSARFMQYPVKGLLDVYEEVIKILLMLQVFLAEDPEIEYLFCCAPSGSEICLLFCNYLFCLWLESVKNIDNLERHTMPKRNQILASSIFHFGVACS